MAYYLQMDGVDDYIRTPTITFTECIMEFSATPGSFRTYFDAASGVPSSNFTRNGSNQDAWSTGISAIYQNGVAQTSGTGFVNGTKSTYRIVLPVAGTDNVNIFSGQLGTGSTTVQGNIYSVKFYNGATLVASYDMSLGNLVPGTVQDQSGNARHATLNGGTWIEDPTGPVEPSEPGRYPYITPSDSDNLPGTTKAILISAPGSIKVDFAEHGTVTLSGMIVGKPYNFAIKKVYATGTTATGIIGYYV